MHSWEAAWYWTDFLLGCRGASSWRRKPEVPGEMELYQMATPPTIAVTLLVTDDRMLYRKELGWSLSLFLGKEPLNAWNFLSDKSVFILPDGYLGPNLTTKVYGDEVTHGGPLGSLMMEAGLVGKINHVIRGLELWVTLYQPGIQGDEEGWRLSQITWPMTQSTNSQSINQVCPHH